MKDSQSKYPDADVRGQLRGGVKLLSQRLADALAEVERMRAAHNGEVCVDVQEAYDAMKAENERLRSLPTYHEIQNEQVIETLLQRAEKAEADRSRLIDELSYADLRASGGLPETQENLRAKLDEALTGKALAEQAFRLIKAEKGARDAALDRARAQILKLLEAAHAVVAVYGLTQTDAGEHFLTMLAEIDEI